MSEQAYAPDQSRAIQLPEALHEHPDSLPLGEDLLQAYEYELQELEMPVVASLARPGEDYNISYLSLGIKDVNDEQYALDPVLLAEKYVRDAAKDATTGSWWKKTADNLKSYGVDTNDPDNMRVAAKHTLEVAVDGKPLGQQYEIFEIGNGQMDPERLQTVLDTLQAIDQMTGGLTAADERRQRIVLAHDMDLQSEGDRKKATAGFVDEYGTVVVLGMKSLERRAAEEGIDPKALIAVVLTHELAGHGLEYLMEGRHGAYYDRHFDYSEEKVADDEYGHRHAAITPKAADAPADSQPMRRYGHVSSAEDWATSVDTVYMDAMADSDLKARVDPERNDTDAYRRDKVLGMMALAAEKAGQYDGTPGIAGSEIRYIRDAAGNITGAEPARQFSLETISGEQAVREEILKVVGRYHPPKEFIVKINTFLF